MNRGDLFHPRRFGYLVLGDLVIGTQALLVAGAAAIGLLLVLNVASVASADSWPFHRVFFPLTLLIGGHVATSLAFRDMHSPGRGYQYLTLPGSHLEKFAARLLLTSIGWIVGATAAYALFSALAAALTTLLFGTAHGLFNPVGRDVWPVLRVYLITQAVTLFGAVTFKRLHLLKTILAVTAFGVALAVLSGVLARLVLFDGFRGGFLSIDGHHWRAALEDGGSLGRLYRFLLDALAFSLRRLLAPFFWVLGYLRLRETEV